jgi:hypothetical protein
MEVIKYYHKMTMTMHFHIRSSSLFIGIIKIQFVETELNLFKALFHRPIMNQSLCSYEYSYDYSNMLNRVTLCVTIIIIIIIIIIIDGRLHLNNFWPHILCRLFLSYFSFDSFYTRWYCNVSLGIRSSVYKFYYSWHVNFLIFRG